MIHQFRKGDLPMKAYFLIAFLLAGPVAGFADLPDWALLTPGKGIQITENSDRKLLPFSRSECDVVILEFMADGLKHSGMTETENGFRGELLLPDGAGFRVESSFRKLHPQAFEWRMVLSSDRPQKVKQFWAGLNLNPAMKGRSVEFAMSSKETQRVVLPEPEGGFRWIFSTLRKGETAEALTIPMRRGALRISGFRTPVQVARYGKNGSNIRLLCATGERPVRELEICLKVEYLPCIPVTFSLRGAANMGFADPVANDGKGGWTDQGPENDLSPMTPGLRRFGDIPFEIPDPAENSGKSCLVFRNSARPGLLRTAEIPGNGAVADTLYFLHAAAWVQKGRTIATVLVRYQDGTRQEISILDGRDAGNWWEPEDLENGVVVWRAENRSAKVGLYLSRFPIQPKPIRSLLLTTEGTTLWMVAGITGIRGLHAPVSASPVREVSCDIVPGNVWKPFRYSKRIEPGSALDFSGFEKHAPAGKYGRVIVKGEHFCFEHRPEMRVRFFGTNVAYWGAMFPTDRELDELPRRLRAVGYNAVRFHHFDEYIVEKGSALKFRKEKLDRWFRTFARYKELGFYITLDLFTLRRDGFSGADASRDAFYQKALILFDPAVRSEMKEFVRQLLGTVNPYTGMTVAEDPALLSVGLVNEDKMFTPHEILRYGTADSRMSGIFRRGFAAWCRKNALPGESVPTDRTWARYVADTHLELFREFRSLLDDLNCKAPVSDISSGFEYILAPIRNHFDYTDLHSYHDHPEFPGAKWKPPMEFEDISAISAYARSPLDAVASRILGKPFLLTEWHFSAPNSWRSESGVLMGALSAFQGIDGIFDFWGMPDAPFGILEEEPLSRGMGVFDTMNDPVSLLSSRIINFFYLRGDVDEAKQTIALEVPETIRDRSYALDFKNWKNVRNAVPPPAFTRLGLFAKTGIRVVSEPGRGGFFADEVARLAGAAEKDPDLFLRKAGIPEKGEMRSCSGQIVFHPGKNRFKVVTPKSEALIQEEKENRGKALSVDNNTVFSTVFAGSLDNRPLEESRHVLFLHLTDVKPGKIRCTRLGTRLRVYEKGTYPYLLRIGSAEISLKNRAPGTGVLFTLDVSGKRRRTIPFTENNGIISFRADNSSGDDSPLAYELIRQEENAGLSSGHSRKYSRLSK